MSEQEEPAYLATPKNVWLPIGVSVALILAISGGAIALNSQLLAIDYSIRTLDARIDGLQGRIDSRLREIEGKMEADGAKLRTEVRAWVNLVRARNEGESKLVIPTFPVGD
jgi:hypothetical protein